ncbi:MAG: hypothetical protein QM813_20850 [Verrucomicrobiota bacterium]
MIRFGLHHSYSANMASGVSRGWPIDPMALLWNFWLECRWRYDRKARRLVLLAIWLGGLIAAVCFSSSAVAAASVERYSFQEDFSFTENTAKSIWSYRFQANGVPDNTARDGQYELMLDPVDSPTSYSPNSKTGWCDSAGFNGTVEMPQVIKNVATYVNDGIPPKEVVVHPDRNQIVVVSWLAPRSGTIKVSFEFTDLVVYRIAGLR